MQTLNTAVTKALLALTLAVTTLSVNAGYTLSDQLVKAAIDESVRKHVKQANVIANKTCAAGAKQLMITVALQEKQASDAISRQLNSMGLVLAILKVSDPETYDIVRKKAINANLDQLEGIFEFNEEFGRACNQNNSFKEVLYTSIRYH